MDCIFCKIIDRELPGKIVFEDDKIFAFYDIIPKAPVHILIIPKQHIPSAADITSENCEIIAYLFSKIPIIAKEAGLDSFRIVINNGEDAGQTVNHLHFHLLGQ